MLCRNVAIVWPGLANAGPTMLGYVMLKCCDRLAGACKCWANNVGICYAEMLRSFGRGLQMLGQQCWAEMLRTLAAAYLAFPWLTQSFIE